MQTIKSSEGKMSVKEESSESEDEEESSEEEQSVSVRSEKDYIEREK